MIDFYDPSKMTPQERKDWHSRLILFYDFPVFLTEEELNSPTWKPFLANFPVCCGGTKISSLESFFQTVRTFFRKVSFRSPIFMRELKHENFNH